MQSQVHYLANPSQTQVVFNKILMKVTNLYEKYVPKSVRFRKNVHLQMQPDVILISSYIWALQQGCKSANAIHRAIRTNLFPECFPERSRFCRICQNLSQTIQMMRYYFVKPLISDCEFGIIDSFPCALCKPIRNCRAKLLESTANIGFNATKQEHYYGIKFSVVVGDNGFPVNYVVTPASVHDSQTAYELLTTSPFSIVYGDKGYVTKSLKESLLGCGIKLITQLRENMSDYSKLENYRIGRLRKPIETVFSSLEQFGIEDLRCRNLYALKFKVEAILLTYSLLLHQSQMENGFSLRYSLAYA